MLVDGIDPKSIWRKDDMDLWVFATPGKEQKTYFLSLVYIADFPKMAFSSYNP